MIRRPNRFLVAALLAFGVSFGFTEAATVAYIRLVSQMPNGLDYRDVWAQRGLPLDGDTIVAEMSRMRLLPLEYGREVATLVLLAAVAFIGGRSRRERLASFVLVFTVWDLSYYGWLRLFCGFPRSVVQTDIYFLLPFPTFGPVWFPLALMTAGLLWSLRQLRGPARHDA